MDRAGGGGGLLLPCEVAGGGAAPIRTRTSGTTCPLAGSAASTCPPFFPSPPPPPRPAPPPTPPPTPHTDPHTNAEPDQVHATDGALLRGDTTEGRPLQKAKETHPSATLPTWNAHRPPSTPPHGMERRQGCIGREGASEVAPETVRQAVGGGCQSGWGAVTVGYKCH